MEEILREQTRIEKALSSLKNKFYCVAKLNYFEMYDIVVNDDKINFERMDTSYKVFKNEANFDIGDITVSDKIDFLQNYKRLIETNLAVLGKCKVDCGEIGFETFDNYFKLYLSGYEHDVFLKYHPFNDLVSVNLSDGKIDNFLSLDISVDDGEVFDLIGANDDTDIVVDGKYSNGDYNVISNDNTLILRKEK